jgi:hypothetical protein
VSGPGASKDVRVSAARLAPSRTKPMKRRDFSAYLP